MQRHVTSPMVFSVTRSRINRDISANFILKQLFSRLHEQLKPKEANEKKLNVSFGVCRRRARVFKAKTVCRSGTL